MTEKFRNPLPTVDIIIEVAESIVLIERRNPPHGWALPGGFVDYGESLENAAVREAREETSLEVKLIEQFHTYSDPRRDPRHHTLSTVFIGTARGEPEAADDANGPHRPDELVDLFRAEEVLLNLVLDDTVTGLFHGEAGECFGVRGDCIGHRRDDLIDLFL